MNFFCIFFAKNLWYSKKCCNFAPFLETAPTISPAKVQKVLQKNKKKITKSCFLLKNYLIYV